MGRNAVDYPRPENVVHEPPGEYGEGLAREWRHDMSTNEIAPVEGPDRHDIVLLLSHARQGRRTDNPEFPVDSGLRIFGLRVDPHVRRPVNRFGAQGRGDQGPLPQMELDQIEFLRGDPLPFHSVMVPRGTLVEGAPYHWMCPLHHIPPFPEPQILPLDELPVGRVDGPEFTPPINAESCVFHHLPADLG